MLQNSVKLSIPFESLVESLKVLGFSEKYQIWKLLGKPGTAPVFLDKRRFIW